LEAIMLFDKSLMFYDGNATSEDSVIVDMGIPNVGKGEELLWGVIGNGVTAGTVVTLEHSLTTTPGDFAKIVDLVVLPEAINFGVFFGIPSHCNRYLRITSTDMAGGTLTAGIVKDAQLNL
jgi:hypothetical protein